jgi:hypothetical protein
MPGCWSCSRLSARRSGTSGARERHAGAVYSRDRLPFSVLGFTVTDGLITEIDILADPDRLGQLDLSGL